MLDEIPTMDVRINGRIEQRTYSISQPAGTRFQLKEPDLNDGEIIVWLIGDHVPTIYKELDVNRA